MRVHPFDGFGCGLQLQVLESCSAGCSEKRNIYICIEISNFQLKQTISACSRGNGMHSN